MEKPVLSLYITHLEKEGPFLKVWGQADKPNSMYVEQFLLGASNQFEAGVGVMQPESLQVGTLVCAKYKDNKYYRARLVDNSYMKEGFVEVTFQDLGNRDMVPCANIRDIHNFPSSFISVPPLAACFIFAEAHCIGGGEWNDITFHVISKEMKYQEAQCTLVGQATQYYLVKLAINGTDLCNLFIKERFMQPISLAAQQAVILSMSIQKSNTPSAAPPPTTPSTGLNTYKACTLEPGCIYPVYVSYVNDGPCHFSVQLKQSEEVLSMLMADINSVTLKPLEDIPIPGTICLARCQEDGNICRAVVTNEVDNQFKVFYVDFGNYEVVPLDAIYTIPFKYVLPKVMAIRFALNGIEKPSVTMEMQCAFKAFVDNRLLHMKVLPTPTRMAIPKCELWDSETKMSALDVVLRSAKHAYPEPISLQRGFSQPVKVSFVYSCNRFYVQLVSKESELVKLMVELQVNGLNNDILDPESIKIGLPCCALFEIDQQWYRAEIVEILDNSVKVRYIDYGNEDTVPNSQLKIIDGEQLTVLRPQAIECCLNGYQNMEQDAERDTLLEEIILEGNFHMKVVEMLGKKALVELFDSSNYNVASLLLDKLAAAKSQVSPVLAVQAGNKIEHRKSSVPPNQFVPRQERKPDSENTKWRSNDGNERHEKPWRQGNDYRKSEEKSNENFHEPSSWRDKNKGFSPKHKKYGNNENTDCDRWNNVKSPDHFNPSNPKGTESWKASNDRNQDGWITTNDRYQDSSKTSNDGNQDSWKASSDRSQENWKASNERSQDGWKAGDNKSQDNWNKNYKKDWNQHDDRGDNYGQNKGRFDNNRDRYGDKHRDGGYSKRQDPKLDASDRSSDGSEKGYRKGPRTSSRNERGGSQSRFNKPYEKSARNNSYSTNSGENSWNVSNITQQDLAPATATFKLYDVVGTTSTVAISWFHNPSHFYCQQVDFQETFKKLMQEIQQSYKGRKSESSAVGAPIVALFPEDNVLYRAQVLQVIGNQYKVYYVDFGNVSTVNKIWPIEKKFMELPAQAIACSLYNIKPTNAEWPVADNFSDYFDKDRFTCSFINIDEEKTYVNIYYENEDISELLVRDGHAVYAKSEQKDFEIPLLLAQQFRCVVKSINNLDDIIIALECGLALNCSMHNLSFATETYEDVLKGLLEQTLIAYVDNIIDNKLEITLYDLEGNKYIIINPDEGAFDNVESLCPFLITSSTLVGYVSHVDDNSIFVQPDEYSETFEWLRNEMFEYYNNNPLDTPIIPEEEQIYAVHSADGNWYRGRVVSFDDEKASISYVDYGNTEEVEFKELRELEPQFREIFMMGFPVYMGSSLTDLIDKLVTLDISYGENGWEGTIVKVGEGDSGDADAIDVSPEETETATLTCHKAQGTLENENIVEENDTQQPNLEQKGKEVYISHIDTPDDFYVQLSSDALNIENVQAKLQAEVDDMQILENPAAGILCAAPYSVDSVWYRAEILDADDDITTVRFIDFGNTDVIDNNKTQVKTLTPDLLSLAVYATRCSMNIESPDEEWSAAAMDRFEHLTNVDQITAVFLDQDERANYVELYSNGQNVKEILIQEKLAVPVTNPTESKSTGFVSHLNSPSEFWIQLEICVDELEWIAEQLSTADSFPELEDLTPGTLCAALFSDDDMWYRARILSNTVAGIELLFIDYGNSCTSASLRQLPEDLVITPPLAQKCSLEKPKGISVWTTQMCEKFEEISAGGQTIFTVKKMSTGETAVVQLLLDGQDVVELLIPKTENCIIKTFESLDSLEIEKNGEILPEKYSLENMNGTKWTEESVEKLKEIGAEGNTNFQIEFLPDNMVRIYLDQEDIRPRLSPAKILHPNVSNSSDLNDEANGYIDIQEDKADNDNHIGSPNSHGDVAVDELSEHLTATTLTSNEAQNSADQFVNDVDNASKEFEIKFENETHTEVSTGNEIKNDHTAETGTVSATEDFEIKDQTEEKNETHTEASSENEIKTDSTSETATIAIEEFVMEEQKQVDNDTPSEASTVNERQNNISTEIVTEVSEIQDGKEAGNQTQTEESKDEMLTDNTNDLNQKELEQKTHAVEPTDTELEPTKDNIGHNDNDKLPNK